MFKHRLSKFGRASLFAACMLIVGGSMNSCQDKLDDYKYDDEEPTWLGASIYDFLKEGSPGHTYNNFVELIDSLGEAETLAHTGSKTLFVADDIAFEEFYKNNPWGVNSVAEMTKAQMKIILKSAMLDNTLQLDMLSSTGATAGSEGTCLRRKTSASVLDSIPLLDSNLGKEVPVYNRFWSALRGKENAEKLRIAMDGSDAMMVHILGDYLKNNAIEASDIEFLFKKNGVQTKTYTSDEVLIFDSKLVASEVATDGFSDDTVTITCKNGSVFRLDKVLLPPSNMAQELRNHSETKVFSHLIDRFCIPVYDAGLTADYRAYYKTDDSIFTLKYFVKERFTNHNLLTDVTNPKADELLSLDPGWNSNANSLSAERDMAAMFVPSDTVLYEYFVNGAGNFLLKRFANNAVITDVNSLLAALDSVPERNIVPLLNNMMKPSFVGSVLSKFDRVTDTANDPMGIQEGDVEECVIANNGVIYILNNVFGPPEYEAVSAPTLVLENMVIMNKLIEQLRYDYYLLAMDAKYSFIVPDNEYFVYYDPVTFSSDDPKMYSFHYNSERKGNSQKAVELWADVYEFDPKTYEVTDTLTPVKYTLGDKGSGFGGNAFMKNRMTDLLEYLIVVHGEEQQFVPEKKYYQTKGYGYMKVDATDQNALKIYGGEQIENGSVIVTSSTHPQENGNTYCTVPGNEDSPTRKYSGIPTPPTKSVYERMLANADEEDDMYYEFFSMCNPDGLSDLFSEVIYPDLGKNAKNDTIELYSVFYSSSDGTMRYMVPFFNIFHYTVYVPSNNSIKNLYSKGFPTWDKVNEYAATQPGKAASIIRQINNFIRYHFQDNSVFYESGSPFSIPSTEPGNPYYEANFSTALINDRTGRFYETTVKSNSTNSTLVITDQLGNDANVINSGEEGVTYNVMARDIVYKNQSIYSSSFSVLQPIDNVLLNDGLYGWDGDFRRFVSTGELVDTMMVDVDGSAERFLVANCANYSLIALDGTNKTMRTGYLLTEIDESNVLWDPHYTQEDFIYRNGERMLITEEGVLITTTKTGAEYIKETDADGNVFVLKVNSNGEIIKRIPYVEAE